MYLNVIEKDTNEIMTDEQVPLVSNYQQSICMSSLNHTKKFCL